MNLAEIASSPAAFRNVLLIDTDAGPKPLAKAMDPWQRRDFEALDPSLARVARRSNQPAVNRAYLERHRGASKSSDVAVSLSYLLLASSQRMSCVSAAADKDQAKILRDAIEKLLRLNPWLAEVLEVQAYKVLNKRRGSTLEILAADAASSYGLLCDCIICDELTHWPDGAGERLWTSLFSSAAKKRDCLLLVASNAGIGVGTAWQWAIREAARESPDWYFSSLDPEDPDQRASWISQKILDEQRRMLPSLAFERLWLNKWVSNSADVLPEHEIAAAVRLDGPPTDTGNYLHVAGLDLGLKRDASALVVLAKEPEGDRLKLVHVKDWKAKPGEKVSIEEIEKHILEVNQRFELQDVRFDPWAAQYLAERLDKAGIPMHETPFSAKNSQAMASAMIEAFGERRLELWDHPTLLSDLRSLRIELKGNGYKLAADRNKDGHADRAFALALALLAAQDASGRGPAIRVCDIFADDPEVDELLKELREDDARMRKELIELRAADEPGRGWQSETYEW